MSLRLHITPGSELPIYRQIMRQVTDAIAGGRLAPGDKLTSQRDLAEQLVVSPLTVKKAYDELEREGLIETMRGRGTFVATSSDEVDTGHQLERLEEATRQLLHRAHLAGVSLPEVQDLIDQTHQRLSAERQAADRERSES